MGDVGTTIYARFPPLASVVGLEDAPPPVLTLLDARWMAVPGDATGASFLLRWSLSERPCRPSASEPSAVRWQPTGDVGVLANAGGRLTVIPGRSEARVELFDGAVEDAACLEALVEAALGHALAARGESFLHAGAVELGDRRPVLLGRSGSGKSTLAAAVAAFGGRVVSDDSLLLGSAEGRPTVRAARRNLLLRAGADAILDALRARGLPTEQSADGRIRVVREAASESFVESTRPDALVVLRRDSTVATVVGRLLTQGEALAALLQATSALYVTDGRYASHYPGYLESMARAAEALPAIELRIGTLLVRSPAECLAAVERALP